MMDGICAMVSWRGFGNVIGFVGDGIYIIYVGLVCSARMMMDVVMVDCYQRNR